MAAANDARRCAPPDRFRRVAFSGGVCGGLLSPQLGKRDANLRFAVSSFWFLDLPFQELS